MHKLILKTFDLLKNFVYFLKILAIFFLMLHLIYWIQDLTNAHYGWLQFFTPILSFFVSIGEAVSKGSIDLLGAKFTFSYMIALLIYVGLYFVGNFVIAILCGLENKYDDLNIYVKKTQETSYNNSLQRKQTEIETKLQRYMITVSTSLKDKFSHPELGYNLEEQNKIMNNYLIEKTGVRPTQFEGGFLYSFDDFSSVDKILKVFFKLIHSNSPLDYVICLQVVEKDDSSCKAALKLLMELKHENKITMLADSRYRYKFNKSHLFGTSQLGLFQKYGDTAELYEFVEI